MPSSHHFRHCPCSGGCTWPPARSPCSGSPASRCSAASASESARPRDPGRASGSPGPRLQRRNNPNNRRSLKGRSGCLDKGASIYDVLDGPFPHYMQIHATSLSSLASTNLSPTGCGRHIWVPPPAINLSPDSIVCTLQLLADMVGGW